MALRYVLLRVVASAAMAAAATLVVFLVAHTVPADPVLAQLGDKQSGNPETVARFRARWGLDRPLHEQYGIFLARLARGDLGESIASHRPVLDDIRQYVPATIELATVAGLLTIAVGVPLGVAAAVRRDGFVDHVARFVCLIGVSAPTFWLAFIVLALFYGGLEIAPSPGRLDVGAGAPPHATGMFVVDGILAGDWSTVRNALAHLILPSVVLAAATIGIVTRTTRAAMLETLGQDYVRTARAKGVRERGVVRHHAFPNALVPILTLAGLAYAELLAGTVLTETIFSWPGLGRYTYQSALAIDFPAIMGVTFLVALMYLAINFLVDIAYLYVDPRVARR
jgi:peptide/nickel transport system permease protein